MPDPRNQPDRELRDELLSLSPLDPYDAAAALLEVEPEPEEDEEGADDE